MNDPRTFRPATAWPSMLLSVVLLYVLTWPPVELSSAKRRQLDALRYSYGMSDEDAQLFVNRTEFEQPRWLKILYHPLHRIAGASATPNLLIHYWTWWSDRLGMVP